MICILDVAAQAVNEDQESPSRSSVRLSKPRALALQNELLGGTRLSVLSKYIDLIKSYLFEIYSQECITAYTIYHFMDLILLVNILSLNCSEFHFLFI